MRALLALVALLLMTSVVPTAAAEFGHEDEHGWPVNVDGESVIPPFPPVIITNDPLRTAEPINRPAGLTVYPYYPLLTAELTRLAREHPEIVKLTSAGKSTLGLDLWLLEIADFARIDAGEGKPLEGREVVYLDGGTHSNEYSGVYFVTEWAQFLLDEYETNETAKWIVENRHTFILPMVNPDGSNAFGRLNAKTVNINRNFPATWGAIEEAPVVNNPGPSPGSEPETQTVMALMDKIQPDYVNSIHCCGNLWLHPWGAEHIPPALDLQMFTRICDEVFADVREACGPIWSTIYPASGTTADEGYNRTGASSWTYEMSGRARVQAGWGTPVIAEDPRIQEIESWNGVLHAFLHVEKYGAYPVVTAIAGTAGALDITIRNDGYGNLTMATLTVAGKATPVPWLGPGDSATLTVEGVFAAGTLPITLDYVKRLHLAPTGSTTIDVALVQEGGRLVGKLGDDAVVPLDAPAANIPAPGLLAGLAALGGALLVARRR